MKWKRQVKELVDKIARYMQGEFDYKGGSLIFSSSKIEINMKPDEILKDSFTIEEVSGRIVGGYIYSTELLLQCEIEEFEGSKIEIPYCVDSRNKLPGDVIKGEFHIISEVGEYAIPFVVTVLYETIESSLGNIKNLFHFTNLAKSNWEEAVKIFYHSNFLSILNGNDSRYRSLYKGLTVCGNPNRNLEEFLIGINKKKIVEYETDKNDIKLINPEHMTSQTIRITRSGWGHLHLKVEREGDFISLERQLLTDDDFLGNTCEYNFYINENALHEGNNYGRIVFEHSYGKFEVMLQVVRRMEGRGLHISHQKKRLTYSLTRYYLDFRMKRLSMSKWLSQTKDVLAHQRNCDKNIVDSSLFEAHLLLTQEHYNEAKWMLDHTIEDPEQLDDTRYCYYLYLTSLYSADEYYSRQIADRVEAVFKQNPGNWRIAWLLLYLSADVNKTTVSRWNFALQQIEEGCISPIFYVETLSILNAQPSLLVHLEDAQLKLLLYGAKMQYLSADLMQQITSIAGRIKYYDNRLVKILRLIYERKPQEEILRVICMQLMKGDCTDLESFSWYEKGIMQNLPITRLYEYYMMSMDISREREIQKSAVMYFSYQCVLPWDITAFLYQYVVKNKEKLGELYDAYVPQIERFLVKQLYAGKVNGNLAYLYQEILMNGMLTPDNIQQFANVLFINKISVANPIIKNIVVLDDRMNEEMVYPVTNGDAYVSLFSNEHTILLEDDRGNRYFGSQDYQTERYFLPRKYISILGNYAKDDIIYNLFVCGDNRNMFTITDKNAQRCLYLLKIPQIETEFKKVLQMSLLQYYFELDDSVQMDALLEEISQVEVLYKNRGEIVKYLALHGFYEKAYDFALSYGAEKIDAKTLVRICTNLLESGNRDGSREMTYMLYSAFVRGKYNESGLQYLIANYKGLSKNLRNIWKAAVSFEVDAYPICERLLVQTLQTGAFVADEGAIYQCFTKEVSKTDLNRAYLSYRSYEYLIQDRIMEEFIFEGVKRLYENGRTIPDVCMLAYLKYYSHKVTVLSEEQKKVCREFLRILYVDKHIVLSFFADFKSISTEAAHIANGVMIEYRGNPESTVVVHYVVSRDEEDESCGYIREEMKNMFGGIFVKEFILFFGESLQYYITEEYANREQLTASGTLQKDEEIADETGNRYSMVNDIAVAVTLKDYSTAKELLEEYAKKEFITEALFTLQ